MKKLLAVTTAILMLLCCLTACGQKPEPDPGKDNDVSISTGTDDNSEVLPDDSTDDSTDESLDATDATDDSLDATDESTDSTDEVSDDTTTVADKTTKSTTKSSVADKTTKCTTKSSVADKTTKSSSKNDKTTKSSTTPSKITTTTAATSSKVLTPDSTTTKKPTTQSTGTTKSTKKTITVKTTTTTTTTAPTTTTKDPNLKSIKVLSIGHSFSVDAMRTYLWDIFKSAGYDEIILGYLYIGGCPLEKHWTNAQGNIAAYQYSKNEAGRWSDRYNQTSKSALLDEAWDYVTFQPSPDYGGGPECCGSNNNDYKNFNNLVNWVLDNATNPYVQIHYHLTWSFATDCKLWSFMYHDFDQMKQYNDFIAATNKYVLSNRNVKGVIPCNTAIQNARSSYLGDTFNMPGNYDPDADGYHLNDKGDYVAALTWYAYFSGEKASSVTFIPDEYKDAFPAIAEAVDNAIAKPQKVTQSSYK